MEQEAISKKETEEEIESWLYLSIPIIDNNRL